MVFVNGELLPDRWGEVPEAGEVGRLGKGTRTTGDQRQQREGGNQQGGGEAAGAGGGVRGLALLGVGDLEGTERPVWRCERPACSFQERSQYAVYLSVPARRPIRGRRRRRRVVHRPSGGLQLVRLPEFPDRLERDHGRHGADPAGGDPGSPTPSERQGLYITSLRRRRLPHDRVTRQVKARGLISLTVSEELTAVRVTLDASQDAPAAGGLARELVIQTAELADSVRWFAVQPIKTTGEGDETGLRKARGPRSATARCPREGEPARLDDGPGVCTGLVMLSAIECRLEGAVETHSVALDLSQKGTSTGAWGRRKAVTPVEEGSGTRPCSPECCPRLPKKRRSRRRRR